MICWDFGLYAIIMKIYFLLAIVKIFVWRICLVARLMMMGIGVSMFIFS